MYIGQEYSSFVSSPQIGEILSRISEVTHSIPPHAAPLTIHDNVFCDIPDIQNPSHDTNGKLYDSNDQKIYPTLNNISSLKVDEPRQ